MFDKNKALSKLKEIRDLYLAEDLNMAPYSNFKLGGPADIYIRPQTEEAFIAAIQVIRKEDWPLTVLGRATNVLISDRGIRGIVCQLSPDMARIDINDDQLTASAGARLSDIAARAAAAGLAGLAFSSGIPGSVGGAVVMNAGAYTGKMEDVVASSQYMDARGEVHVLEAAEHNFHYRGSFFNDHKDHLVINTVFQLQPGPVGEIYDEMADIALRRYQSQPLNYPSGGSAFKRPPGHYAGKLITDAGLKGFWNGHAGVSDKHAGFIIQDGKATASEVLEVFRIVQTKVHEEFDVMLYPEVKFIGDWQEEMPLRDSE
ncbi:MAG: UDP-N-acetylmuramate dehydrogenase [Eubacteriales bacterium]|nr:UDP-N-acetylmuramate dehydrogenase [Eubacteriales bacterium]MDD4324407.1 UDP-N-acetylmuramate dehydrogenase [Eubacteriales bacterium]MDD4541647.1 UDP-N-acetylmuramate dehydrogenase [Eubacteriales bacterium]